MRRPGRQDRRAAPALCGAAGIRRREVPAAGVQGRVAFVGAGRLTGRPAPTTIGGTNRTDGELKMIDRAFQRKILETAREAYPLGIMDPAHEFADRGKRELWANIQYLVEHGLIEGIDASTLGDPVSYADVRITARGIDFLEDDGGLSAILGTVTVRFDHGQFREMLAAHVEKMEGDPSAKAQLKAVIRSLPADGLKAVALQALMAGLQNLPSIDAVRKWLLPG